MKTPTLKETNGLVEHILDFAEKYGWPKTNDILEAVMDKPETTEHFFEPVAPNAGDWDPQDV